jgi:RNA polymerase sigma factor (sigma-70 family)
MDEALERPWPMAQQDQSISDAFSREGPRLRNFIRKHVADPGDAEDILQDVFYELVEAYRMIRPVEQVTAWLFRVAHNRIADLFRRKSREGLRTGSAPLTEDGEMFLPENFLRSPDAGPEEAYVRGILIKELDDALDELPEEQREAFIAHELMGYSFKEMAARSGIGVNTLLSRKHYAVVHLRNRLRAIYEEFAKR